MPDSSWLDQQVIVCLGPGGVGKTSTSAAMGVAAASRGRRAVVLTIDPAKRLADAMGLTGSERTKEQTGSPIGNDPVRIAGAWDDHGGELWGVMLDAESTFDDLVKRTAETPGQAERILNNALYRNLVENFAGTHEYMAAERLLALHSDDRFDQVIVDTPPSRHAFDFLDAPDRLVRFIDHPLYRTVLAPRRGIFRVVNAAGQVGLRIVSSLIGAELLTEVIDFFAAFEEMDSGFRDRAVTLSNLVHSSDTTFVVVTIPRDKAINAAGWIHRELAQRKLTTSALIANRVLAKELIADADPTDTPVAGTSNVIEQNLKELSGLAKAERAMVSSLAAQVGAGYVMLEEQAEPVDDIDGLTVLAEELSQEAR